MSPADLVDIIRDLEENQPVTDAFENRTVRGYADGRRWYGSQKEHLLGFVGEYATPGAYNRARLDGSARDWYQRFQNAAGLLWLAEALGERRGTLDSAVAAILGAGDSAARQCGAFRRVVPWTRIEELIADRQRNP